MMLTPAGDVLAIWAAHPNDTTLEVPLLRIQRGPLLPTIARQISRTLRRRAAKSALTTVRLTDTHLPAAIAAELDRDGFRTDAATNSPTATVLTTIGTWAEVRAAGEAVTESGLVLPAHLGSTAEASEYERLLGRRRSSTPTCPPTSCPSAASSPTTSSGTYQRSSPDPPSSACPANTSTTGADRVDPRRPVASCGTPAPATKRSSPAPGSSKASPGPRSSAPRVREHRRPHPRAGPSGRRQARQGERSTVRRHRNLQPPDPSGAGPGAVEGHC